MGDSQEGPATAAMQALIANEPCGDGVLDAISKGEPHTYGDDLKQALRLASHHVLTHPTLANQVHMTSTCERLKLWSDTCIDKLDEHVIWRLAKWFRDISTAILKLQEAVYTRGNKIDKTNLLHDRPLQNQISSFMADCYKHQHWDPVYNDQPIVGTFVPVSAATTVGSRDNKDQKGRSPLRQNGALSTS